jgi:hypothetical protein
MPILPINMFPSQHSLWGRTLKHLDDSTRIESTSRDDHFDLPISPCPSFSSKDLQDGKQD